MKEQALNQPFTISPEQERIKALDTHKRTFLEKVNESATRLQPYEVRILRSRYGLNNDYTQTKPTPAKAIAANEGLRINDIMHALDDIHTKLAKNKKLTTLALQYYYELTQTNTMEPDQRSTAVLAEEICRRIAPPKREAFLQTMKENAPQPVSHKTLLLDFLRQPTELPIDKDLSQTPSKHKKPPKPPKYAHLFTDPEQIAANFKHLTKEEQEIVSLRLGLGDQNPLMQRQVANILDLNSQQVVELREKAILEKLTATRTKPQKITMLSQIRDIFTEAGGHLESLIDVLTEKEAAVLRARLSTKRKKPKSQNQASQETGINEFTFSRIERQILTKIKAKMNELTETKASEAKTSQEPIVVFDARAV